MVISKAKKEDIEKIVQLNKLFHLNGENFCYDKKEWVRKKVEEGYYFVYKEKETIVGAIHFGFGKTENFVKINTIAIIPITLLINR